MRLIACGGRHFEDRPLIFAALDALNPSFLITGFDPKSDTPQLSDRYSYEWAKDRGVRGKLFPAQWAKYGKSAGPRRNHLMLLESPDFVVAFPGHVGTAHMCEIATDAGIWVIRAGASDRPLAEATHRRSER